MSALHEWYRYVDSLVRPSRRFEELEEWWVPEDGAEEPVEPAFECGGRRAEGGVSDKDASGPVATPHSELRTPHSKAPPPLDAGTVVARLAAYHPAPPAPVEWSLQRGECAVPDLAQFIPALGAAPEPGAAARAFQEIVQRAQAAPAAPAVARPATPPAPEPLDHGERAPAPRSGDPHPWPLAAPPRETAERDSQNPTAAPPPLPRETLRLPRPSPEPSAPAVPEAIVAPPGAWAPPCIEPEEPERRTGKMIEPVGRDGEGAAPAESLARSSPSAEGPAATPPSRHHALPLPVASLPEAAPAGTAEAPAAATPGLAERIPMASAGAAAGERFDLPTIGAIREGLPRTMERLLQIPITEEVAQNSYKSPFRETREELIQRLFDPPLTLEEAARILGVCPTTVRRYTNKGLLHHYRTQGNQRRFRLSDLLEFLEQWGDAGPDAGALGGSASSRRGKSERPRPPRAALRSTGGDKDAEQTESAVAAADA